MAEPVVNVGKETLENRAASKCSRMFAGFDSGEFLDPRPDGQTELLSGTDFNKFKPVVQYEGGTVHERSATITTDPKSSSNRALRFRLLEANVADNNGYVSKGRVQLNLYVNSGVVSRELTVAVSMYLTPDLLALDSIPQTFNFLTLSEWWNDPHWTNSRYPFRIGLNIVKTDRTPGAPLQFMASSASLDTRTNVWSSVWKEVNTRATVPIGEWVRLEYFIREGNAGKGRFKLALVREDNRRTVLFDVTNWTHHPSDPAPDGISHFNPMKFYTSRQLIDYLRGKGKTPQVLWDDFAVRSCD